MQGGLLEIISRSIEIETLPDEIPESFSVDVSELMIGQSWLAMLGGREEEAWSLLDAVVDMERDIGRDTTLRLSENRARLLLQAGRFQEARAVLASVVDAFEQQGELSDAAVASCGLGLAALRLGDLAGARASEFRATILNPEGGRDSVRSRWGVESLSSLLARMERDRVASGVPKVHRNFRLVGHAASLREEADGLP